MPRRAYILLFLLPCLLDIVSINLFSQVHANFSAISASGCTPITVTFKDSSTGGATAWSWNLGNGTTSTLKNPAATYFTPGTYTVRLTASNGNDKSTITKMNFVTVFEKPTIAFDAGQAIGCFPLSVPFTDKSTAGSGTIVTWLWDFGDGNISNLQNPTHLYQNAGKFNVTLTARNSNGCVTSLTKPNFITVTEGLNVFFSNSQPPVCVFPATINFYDNSTGNSINSYLWDFGDGQTSTLYNPTHTYNAQGIYSPSLTISNANGCKSKLERTNSVYIGLAKADFTMPASVCVGTRFDITSNNPLQSKWTFSDGTTDSVANPQKTFNAPGIYTVTLNGNYGTCSDSITKSITILPKAAASFTADNTSGCTPPFNVTFTNTSASGTAMLWEFGDGTFSKLPNPSHTYTTTGDFVVKLQIVNTNGCTGSTAISSFIHIGPPTIESITGPPYKGCIPYAAQFGAVIKPLNDSVSYKWDFGDGATSTLSNPAHTYSVEGSYNVRLIVTAINGGCTDTFTMPKAVVVGQKPHADFIASPLIVCPTESVFFTDKSTGGATSFYWFFGDGDTATLQNPIHGYTDTGYNTVKFVATRSGCSDTIIKKDYIYVTPPAASFKDSFACNNQFQHFFTSTAIPGVTYKWDFGDGDSSSLQNPSHTYKTIGKYVVKAHINGSSSTCDSWNMSIYVLKGDASFNILDSIGCGSTVEHFAAVSDPLYATSYLWDFGDGSTSTDSISQNISHNYIVAGNYTVSLKVRDENNCISKASVPISVSRYGPKADFSVTKKVCKNAPVTFKDLSRIDSNKIIKWIWNFGDTTGLHIFTAPPFMHTYAQNGIYDVTLVVMNATGCTDTVSKAAVLEIIGPTANFSLSASVQCLSTYMGFFNQSLNYSSAVWDFGDGTTSTDISVWHYYTVSKKYSIGLTVTDTSGCSDTIKIDSLITVANAKAFFAMSDTFSNCPPLLLNLTNQSQNFAYMSWDFGDGNTSTVPNPAHTYTLPGLFNVKLTVAGNGGCIDTLVKQVRIAGPNGSFTYNPIIGCSPLTVHFAAKTENTASYTWDFDDGVAVNSSNVILDHVFSNLGSYLPKIILQDAAGCKVPIFGTDSITVKGVNAYIKDLPTYLICDSTTISFQDLSVTNDTIQSYFWAFGDGQTSSQQNPVHSFNVTGNYTVSHKVITASGCMDSATLIAPIKIFATPQINLIGPNSFCVPATVQFSSQWLNKDTSTIVWGWDFGNGQTASTQLPPIQTYKNSGNYNIVSIATNVAGCADTATHLLTVLPLPIIDAGANKFICLGKTYTLSASGGNSYVWETQPSLSCTNCANPIVNTTVPQMYRVTGTDINGCKSTDSVLIQVKYPFPMAVGIGDTLCFGQSFKLNATGAEAYIWTPSRYLNNPTIGNPTSTPDSSVNYRVIGYDTVGCFYDTGYIAIKVYPIPKVNIIEDKITVAAGSTIQLHTTISNDITQLHWTPATGLSCTNCAQPTASPKQDITYTLIATNDGGCTAQDDVNLLVVCSQGNIYIPNTFSPNGDGVNDIFYPRGKGLFGIKAMRVFSRWGELMYEKTNFQPNDIASGWDGTYNGKKLTPDVFVYMIDVICDNNQIFNLKGNVTLLK